MSTNQNTKGTYPPDVPIWVDSERLSGAPCFKGTRVPVDSLFTNLESGLSLDEYLDCFPDVTREQAVAVLEYAQKLTDWNCPGPECRRG
jgi:uncharacterized protein (DUF433 family)